MYLISVKVTHTENTRVIYLHTCEYIPVTIDLMPRTEGGQWFGLTYCFIDG